jgi:hypothetical protein
VARTPKPASRHTAKADTTAAVDTFMADLLHPHKPAIEWLRQLILGAAPGISEGIKWKSPSFRTHEYFATVNLREKTGIAVILHLGAKVRNLGPDGITIDDPAGLLKWLAPDRAIVRFADLADLQRQQTALASLVCNWVAHV